MLRFFCINFENKKHVNQIKIKKNVGFICRAVENRNTALIILHKKFQ
jgi:hypothetical protein